MTWGEHVSRYLVDIQLPGRARYHIGRDASVPVGKVLEGEGEGEGMHVDVEDEGGKWG